MKPLTIETFSALVRTGSFTQAAAPHEGRRLYDYFVAQAQALYTAGPVQTGEFAADMQVHLVNDGPVTIPMRVAPAGG